MTSHVQATSIRSSSLVVYSTPTTVFAYSRTHTHARTRYTHAHPFLPPLMRTVCKPNPVDPSSVWLASEEKNHLTDASMMQASTTLE